MTASWSLRIDERSYNTLREELRTNAGAAILACTLQQTSRENRLLVREIFPARNGMEHIVGPSGHHQLTADFVRDKSEYCADRGYCYISVHVHGGTNRVQFSEPDLAAHERGYPSLVQFLQAPAGGLVLAGEAAAGDIWLPSHERVSLDHVVVAGRRLRTLRAAPLARAPTIDATRHRQSLLLGDEGQRVLKVLKVGVVGAGGVGSVLVELLARLGVGHLVVADPDRLEDTNFSRVLSSRTRDYRPWFWRKRTAKVDIAERAARIANPSAVFEKIFDDFRRPNVVSRFLGCDYLFLAADPMSVRLLFNQVVHQYLIPGLVVGTKARVHERSGALIQVTSTVRFVGPGGACLWCNQLVTPQLLAEEAASPAQRRAQKYVDDPAVKAPSVITLNATGAGLAANWFLFGATDLGAPSYEFCSFDAIDGSVQEQRARSDADCPQCMRRLGAGDTVSLTTLPE